jgi:hypothetical protein
MKGNAKPILLTFDVEEFDVPLEYGIDISEEEQMMIAKKGLDAVDEILDADTKCTLFTTANFALKYPAKIIALSQRHEIGSHSFYHSSFKPEDLKDSLETLETITSRKVYGLRMPRMKQIDPSLIISAGYIYDSSINPTWIPGRYNNLSLPRTSFVEKGLIRLPVSVSANFRIPLFWLAFKNLPYSYYKRLALQSLNKDGYLSLYFHPWEFTDLTSYKIPLHIKKKSGIELSNLLKRLITDFKKEGEFITINSYLENMNGKN